MSFHPNTTSEPLRFAYISLGSNQGSKVGAAEQTLLAAAQELKELSAGEFVLSALYKTEPVDCEPDTAEFINAAVRIQIAESVNAIDVLSALHEIEFTYGRKRSGTANAPRTLDLDLIHLEHCEVNTESLTLPHPRAHLRLFVVAPLADIEGGLIIPGQAETVSELKLKLAAGPTVHRL